MRIRSEGSKSQDARPLARGCSGDVCVRTDGAPVGSLGRTISEPRIGRGVVDIGVSFLSNRDALFGSLDDKLR
jgi:hypothetical protein